MLRTISLVALLSLSACATATRGTHERVMINSEPAGAAAITDLKASAKQSFEDGTTSDFYGCSPTPCSINLPRKSSPVVDMTLDGHQPIKFKILSTWETGSSSVPAGAIISGTARGTYVRVGEPNLLKRIPISGGMFTTGLVTWGVGPVVDLATGSNRSLSPNPVTVFFAPDPQSSNAEETGE